MLHLRTQQNIAIEVIKTLKSRFDSFPIDTSNNRNAPFHEAFLNAFSNNLLDKVESIPVFISLSNWMHGLSTTVGQSFFERVACLLSNGEKKEFKGLKVSEYQRAIVSDIISGLKNGTQSADLQRENKLLSLKNDILDKEIPNFTVDCYFEEADQIICLEIKAVNPNSGIFRVEKEKILLAKAALKNINPDKEIIYFLAFPFDPTAKTAIDYDKDRYMKHSIDCAKFIDSKELLLSGEYWDFLSKDKNTMQQILDIINAIATIDFIEKFEFINDIKNVLIDKQKFESILESWHLFEEKRIIENLSALKSIDDKSVKRALRQNIFNTNGKYNINRSITISKFIGV